MDYRQQIGGRKLGNGAMADEGEYIAFQKSQALCISSLGLIRRYLGVPLTRYKFKGCLPLNRLAWIWWPYGVGRGRCHRPIVAALRRAALWPLQAAHRDRSQEQAAFLFYRSGISSATAFHQSGIFRDTCRRHRTGVAACLLAWPSILRYWLGAFWGHPVRRIGYMPPAIAPDAPGLQYPCLVCFGRKKGQ